MPKTSAKAPSPKRHHFLPRMYLRRFLQKGQLSVYDAKTREIRSQTLENTGLEKNLYTIMLEGGDVNTDMETMFSIIEGAAGPTIDALVKGEEVIAEEQRVEMAFFTALLAVRTPDMIEGARTIIDELGNRIFKDYWKERGKLAMCKAGYTNEDLKEIDRGVNDGEITVVSPEGWALMISIEQAISLISLLTGRRWIVIHAKSRKYGFVTGDVPVILTSKEKRTSGLGRHSVGFAQDDAVVVLPLSNDTALVIQDWGHRIEHRKASQKLVDEINGLGASIFQRFVIGRNHKMMSRWCEQNNFPQGRQKGDRIHINDIIVDAEPIWHITTNPDRVLRPFSLP